MEDTKEQPKICKAEKEDYREIAGFMQQVHDLHSQARPDIYKDVQHFIHWSSLQKTWLTRKFCF